MTDILNEFRKSILGTDATPKEKRAIELVLTGLQEPTKNATGDEILNAMKESAAIVDDTLQSHNDFLTLQLHKAERENRKLREELEVEKDLSEIRYLCFKDEQENVEQLKYVLEMVKLEVSLFGKVSASKAYNAKRAKEILGFIDHELEGDRE